MSEKKKYVLMLAKKFMLSHPRADCSTDFFLKIKAKEKIHTIRGNYELWKKAADEINKGKAILSVREWTGAPYRSKQKELMQFEKIGLQKLELTLLGWFIDDIECDWRTELFAKNDGLSLKDFSSWFEFKIDEPMAIIHFTDFRY